MAFGKAKDGASHALNELLSMGYKVDLLSARPLDKYISLKERLNEHFNILNINYNDLNLGFHSKKEFLKDNNYDILIDNEIRHIKDSLECGITPILYGIDSLYDGYQTDNWNDIPKLVKEIKKGKSDLYE